VKPAAWLFPAASGALFAIGLAVSGMTDPAKVIGFLDVTGDWNPSLAFVMVGAIAVHALLFRLVSRRQAPLFDSAFHEPPTRQVDGKLVAGATLFGVGWGIAGFCPGPGLASLGSVPGAVFVASMALGFLLHKWLLAPRRAPSMEASS
jgi:uncharacterized membrane protein YedE/YeeE